MSKKESHPTDISSKCEVITVVSGKGGTGKTFITASLAYLLQYSGHRVCLIDTDFATQGLSLFILGKSAEKGTSLISEKHSLYHMTKKWDKSIMNIPVPKEADRLGKSDHGLSYKIIISNKQFYDRRLSLGVKDESKKAQEILSDSMGETNDAFRKNYREILKELIFKIKASEEFDYVLIDTRGGFGEYSIVPVTFSDSFLVVVEPDFSSFHQLAKLLTNIDLMAQKENTIPYIRGIIVNKAVEGDEDKFRALVDAKFGIEFGLIWPIPLDTTAVKVYKNQSIPYQAAEGSVFSYKTAKIFTEVFDIVTIEWTQNQKKKWIELVEKIESAYNQQDDEINKTNAGKISKIKELEDELGQKEKELASYKSELDLREDKLKLNLQDKIHEIELANLKKNNVLRILLTIFILISITLSIVSYIQYSTNIELKDRINNIKIYENSDNRVSILSDPSEAQIYVNGKLKGKTPIDIYLPEGVHHLSVRKNGYAVHNETINITSEQKRYSINIKLKPTSSQRID